jgi:ABC-type branched-subunit amino acid transport system ATPase component
MSILSVENLDAGYRDLQVLSDIDTGEYVTIVGPNGAGKSTVMKSIFGLTHHMGGSIVYQGTNIEANNPEENVHQGLAYVPQSNNVFPPLSVQENLEMGGYILDRLPEDTLQVVFNRFPILEERQQQEAGSMSGGQRQMLAMGRAVMIDPALILLDEPSAGIAPDLVDEMFDNIDRIVESGTAVLMIEQNAKEALRRCDRGYVFVNGENRYTNTGEQLLDDKQIRKEFLGG